MILKLTIAICDVDESEASIALRLFEDLCSALRDAGHGGMLQAHLLEPTSGAPAGAGAPDPEAN